MSTQFTYDANKNMKTDAAKGITSIEYNVLNLPSTVQIGGVSQVQYFYSATGNKLVKCETHTHPDGKLGATQSNPGMSADVQNLQQDKPGLPNANFFILFCIEFKASQNQAYPCRSSSFT